MLNNNKYSYIIAVAVLTFLIVFIFIGTQLSSPVPLHKGEVTQKENEEPYNGTDTVFTENPVESVKPKEKKNTMLVDLFGDKKVKSKDIKEKLGIKNKETRKICLAEFKVYSKKEYLNKMNNWHMLSYSDKEIVTALIKNKYYTKKQVVYAGAEESELDVLLGK